jgi:hypothetical protein
MTGTVSHTVDDVIDALAAIVSNFMTGPIVRAQVNNVPLPSYPCAVLTEVNQVDLNVPWLEYQSTSDLLDIHASARIDVQIDFYGQSAGDYCKAMKSAFRSPWAYDKMPDGIKPLYTSDGIQSPLISGEQQYEPRWTLTVSMQYNPVVSLPQQFADEAYVANTFQADA